MPHEKAAAAGTGWQSERVSPFATAGGARPAPLGGVVGIVLGAKGVLFRNRRRQFQAVIGGASAVSTNVCPIPPAYAVRAIRPTRVSSICAAFRVA